MVMAKEMCTISLQSLMHDSDALTPGKHYDIQL